MNLDDLKKSISNMSDDELMSLIRDIRSNRRISKQSINSKTKQTATKQKQEIGLSSLLSNMSAEQIDALINSLEDNKNGQ